MKNITALLIGVLAVATPGLAAGGQASNQPARSNEPAMTLPAAQLAQTGRLSTQRATATSGFLTKQQADELRVRREVQIGKAYWRVGDRTLRFDFTMGGPPAPPPPPDWRPQRPPLASVRIAVGFSAPPAR